MKTSLLIIGLLCTLSALPANAQKLDDDLVPPDVTLPAANAVQTSRVSTTTQSAPGMASAAATPATGTIPGANTRIVGGATTPPPPPSASGYAANPVAQPGSVGKGMFHLDQKPDPSKKDPIAIIDTSKGQITIRLFRQLAPITVANFIDIATKGFYNGLDFHRVDAGFCIQGGCPNGNGTGDYIDPVTHMARYVPLEVTPALKHNAAGVVAMARSKSPDSGSCQFYITLGAKQHLDMQYSIFGGVLSGMDVVNKIAVKDKINSITVQEMP